MAKGPLAWSQDLRGRRTSRRFEDEIEDEDERSRDGFPKIRAPHPPPCVAVLTRLTRCAMLAATMGNWLCWGSDRLAACEARARIP